MANKYQTYFFETPMAQQYPSIGSWYKELRENQLFEVVAVDEKSSTIEVQYLGGEISEFDLDSWAQLELIHAEPPEDAGAGYELSPEDLYSESRTDINNWNNPIDTIEPDMFTGFDD